MKNIKSTKCYVITFLIAATITTLVIAATLKSNIYFKTGYKDGLPKIGAVIYKYDDVFMSYVRGNMEKAALGRAALNIQDSQNDQSRQLEQIDRMIRDEVRVLVVNLVDPKAASEVIDKAKAAKLPVIFFNKEPEASVLVAYEKAWYVGTDSTESGVLQGKMISKLWKKNIEWDKDNDGVLSYVLLKGEPGHPDAEARTKYAIDEIKKSGITVRELDAYPAMWDEVKARDKMDQWISQFGNKIEFVISNNDTMALGAITSLEKNGYISENKFVPVVGVDALPDAVEKIKEGKMVGTVLNDAKNQGTAIINLAINAAEGRNVLDSTSWTLASDKSVRIPYVAITKDNLDAAEQAYK